MIANVKQPPASPGTSLKSLAKGFLLTQRTDGKSPDTLKYYEGILRRVYWYADDPEMRTLYPITHEMEKRAKVVEEHPFESSGYIIVEDARTRIRWVKRVY